jgi:capsular polysaccharide biosynthesis protein
MPDRDPIATLSRGWKKIVAFGLLAAIVGAGLSLLFPLRYGVSMRLLIIQKQLAAADPYTAMKASERIADNLGQILYTTSFRDKVEQANYNTDFSIFADDDNKRRRQWRELIGTQVIRGTGMLQVEVYHEDPEQAEQFARAIAFVLTTEGWKYVGGGDLDISLVDEPLRSRWPVKPNIPGNALTGFVLGAVIGAVYVLSSERRRPIFMA